MGALMILLIQHARRFVQSGRRFDTVSEVALNTLYFFGSHAISLYFTAVFVIPNNYSRLFLGWIAFFFTIHFESLGHLMVLCRVSELLCWFFCLLLSEPTTQL
jgi:hypothetical protein